MNPYHKFIIIAGIICIVAATVIFIVMYNQAHTAVYNYNHFNLK